MGIICHGFRYEGMGLFSPPHTTWVPFGSHLCSFCMDIRQVFTLTFARLLTIKHYACSLLRLATIGFSVFKVVGDKCCRRMLALRSTFPFITGFKCLGSDSLDCSWMHSFYVAHELSDTTYKHYGFTGVSS